jgi:hypothetical protein
LLNTPDEASEADFPLPDLVVGISTSLV